MDDDDQADLYELTQDICEAHGLPAYEVSNHAASNQYQSRHNLTYWRGGDWIGIGPGAHGRLTVDGARIATHAAARPADYQLSAHTPLDRSSLSKLSPLDNARELLALGLRSEVGFDLERITKVTDSEVDSTTLKTLADSGLIRQNGSTVSLTREGRLLADRIAAELSP